MITQQLMNVNTNAGNETLRAGKLRQSSYQSFKSVFDNNPIPMWLVAKDDLSIIYVNKAVVNNYGYLISDLQQMTIQGMGVKGDPEEQFVHSQHVVKYIKRSGEVIYVKMIFPDMEIENRLVMLVSTIEVTDECTIRESLHHAKASLQSIFQISDIGYILFDMELRVFSFNENATEFVYNKYHIGLEKGVCLTDCFPTHKFPYFISSVIKVLDGSSIKYEIDYEQADGMTLWYKIQVAPIKDYNANIIGIMIAIDDITERKNSRKALSSTYKRIIDQNEYMQTIIWKQSHLIRRPLANLKGLLFMLTANPSDEQILTYMQNEFEKMDTVIIEMANDLLKPI